MVNNIKAEMDYFKKQYSASKLQQIDKQGAKLENLGFEIEVLKMNVEQKSDLNEIDKIHSKFEKYCHILAFNDL